jgi:uncharacterized protein (UPF0216 family)
LFESKDPLERAFEAVLGYEIHKLNTHLPKLKRTMSELLKATERTVEAVDGTSIMSKALEVQELARTVPEEFRDRLKLPMIILRRMDLGKSLTTLAVETDRLVVQSA